MSEDKPRSCYDCIHHMPCKWTPMAIAHPPFISDAHIGPYLAAVNEATAQACACFEKAQR